MSDDNDKKSNHLKWKEAIDLLPMAIIPVYKQLSLNEDIILYEGIGGVQTSVGFQQGNLRVILQARFHPSLNYTFQSFQQGQSIDLLMNLVAVGMGGHGDNLISIPGKFLNLSAHSETTNLIFGSSKDKKPDMAGSLDGDCIYGKDKEVDIVKFHLFNYPQHSGSSVRYEGKVLNQRLEFCCEDWVITIDPLEDGKTRYDEWKLKNGFIITHIGQIRKKNNAKFNFAETKDLIISLEYTLSFSEARFIRLMLLVGFSDGVIVAEDWGRKAISTYTSSRSWFNQGTTEPLNLFLCSFHQKRSSDIWRSELVRAINWYVEASAPNVTIETRLILIQSSLELLSWVYFIEEKKAYSKGHFKELKAWEQIKLLMDEIGIQPDVPSNLVHMKKFQLDDNAPDGLQAFTRMRGHITHPTRKDRYYSASFAAKREIQTWASWVLELSLLYVLGYEGKYGNRLKAPLWEGQIEDVPWSKRNK